MSPLFPLALGATSGALLLHEAGTRGRTERLAAALLETLLNAIDATDAQTGAHVRRVARFALILADGADLDEHTQHSVERIALFHDIGKISEALFDIIHEDAELTPEQRRQIATHPQRGADVLAPLAAFYPDLPEGVLSHHERWDGAGYPRKLRGEEIPIGARVVAIADTFDAITFNRRYHRGKSVGDAAQRIADGRGKQFDPDLTDLFLCPPVFRCVEEAMRTDRERQRRRPARERRQAEPEKEVPDVKFRWRDAAIEPPAQDHPPQRSHG